jgi:predicted transport protein
MLFKLNKQTLLPIKQKPFNAEKELQLVIEANLSEIFGLKLVRPEFTLKNKKIDTLAFDSPRKSFVIIEYKKEKNVSVFDQGISYISLILENRGELINEYNETFGAERAIKRSDVKWNRTRMAFISPEFTQYQLQAAESLHLIYPGSEFTIELWEAALYENNMLLLRELTKKTVLKRTQHAENMPGEERRLITKPRHIQKLYADVKNAILGLEQNITVKLKKLETGFVCSGRIFADISIHMKYLRVWLNMKKGSMNDPKKLARDVSKIRHWGSGDYELKLSDTKDLKYILGLVKQAMKYR